MTSKQVATSFVTERYCDMCGKMISDGQHNGGGGETFWGTYIRLLKGAEGSPDIKVDDTPYSNSLIVKIPFSFFNVKVWEVCLDCGELVKNFIESKKPQ